MARPSSREARSTPSPAHWTICSSSETVVRLSDDASMTPPRPTGRGSIRPGPCTSIRPAAGTAFIDIASAGGYVYQGNYLLVLGGTCDIEGVTLAKGKLVVGKT